MKLAIFLSAAAVICTSCTYYVEQETPAGDRPPMENIARLDRPTILNRQNNYTPLPTEDKEAVDGRIVRLGTGGLVAVPQGNTGYRPQPVGEQTPAAVVDLSSFDKAYMAAGKPKFAIFLNRELSDNVHVWDPNSKSTDQKRRNASDD
ncbi:MAG: hypothetical protein HRT88_14335, partial [Lentisphaeraceae bacterium]|nr:hypothetical protein [Lentisphaeraceae bacterium]